MDVTFLSSHTQSCTRDTRTLTDRQADRQTRTDKHRAKQTYRQTHTHTHSAKPTCTHPLHNTPALTKWKNTATVPNHFCSLILLTSQLLPRRPFKRTPGLKCLSSTGSDTLLFSSPRHTSPLPRLRFHHGAFPLMMTS
jgi:hypothetical protein